MGLSRIMMIYSLTLSHFSLAVAADNESSIRLTSAQREAKGGYFLNFSNEKGFFRIRDIDGRLVLLTIYTHLIETSVETLYTKKETRDQLKNREMTPFLRYRKLPSTAAKMYVEKHPETLAAQNLKAILNKKWMKDSKTLPKLREFSNEGFGIWLKNHMANYKVSIFSERILSHGRVTSSNSEVFVFAGSSLSPVTAYWGSRSLTFPSVHTALERSRLEIAPIVFADFST
ncbi:MAG: hypothetical protein JNM39_18505 [Bdellovibrionaceae bacterium]|nr:hypothetical protein [Pseudobdellovibrionaceae bacterium]